MACNVAEGEKSMQDYTEDEKGRTIRADFEFI